MTPTIQIFDDQSMQTPPPPPPPASDLCNNSLYQENHHQLTTASERPDVRNDHQWTPNLRNRIRPMFGSKKNTSYTSALKPDDVKGWLLRRDNEPSSSSTDVAEVTEEHLNAIRKRQALLLVTIQTMTLFHHNQILEHKLSALHRKVVQVQNRQRQRNVRTAAAEE